MTKPLLTILAMILLSVGASACGSSSQGTTQDASKQTSTAGPYKNDRDNDGDNNDDDQHVLNFGQAANPADQQTITTLVTHYFAAAASENGKQACTLLVPFIAESVAEKYGSTLRLRGRTCPVVMSKLFKYNHHELLNKNATLKIMRVGVEGDKSLIALEFPTIPEVRQITARRTEDGTWKILYLLDGILE